MTSSKPTSAGSTDRGAPSGRTAAAAREDERPPTGAAQAPKDRAAGNGDATRAEPVGAPTRRPTPSERFAGVAERLHLGPLIAGIALIVFGLLLLGGTQIAWRGLLDAILAGLGLVLIIGSRRAGSRRGLLVAGVLLAVVLLGVWRADVPLQGGVRFNTVTPLAPQDVTTPFRQTGGTLTIDLRHYRPAPGPPQQVQQVQASIGVGRLVVVLPPGALLQGGITVGEGRVSVVGVNRNGVGLDYPLAPGNAPALAKVNLRVGVGTAEVQVGKLP
ncbi:MAG: hypothetical protein E6G01_11320 [Actinobacteria bacterium]|nr:MAG: hypothetical protein E6G01_11320 [Actinomycetota bacterium]